MPYSWQSVLPYSPQQLIALILDVESYPRFIPFCRHVHIMTRTPTILKAELITTQGWSYVSQVKWTEEEISINHSDFFAQWRVSPLPQGCAVSFRLTLVCRHFIKKKLLEKAVYFLAPRMIKAFTDRAHFLYG